MLCLTNNKKLKHEKFSENRSTKLKSLSLLEFTRKKIGGSRISGKEEPFCTFVEVTSRAEVTLRHLCRGETSLLPCRAFRSEGIEARRRQMARGAMRRYLITAVMGRGFVANTFACWIESKIDASQCVVYARFDHTTRRERQMKLETKLCWYR